MQRHKKEVIIASLTHFKKKKCLSIKQRSSFEDKFNSNVHKEVLCSTIVTVHLAK